MTARRGELGSKGEQIAADFLADDGLKILARNWRTRFGELDIVAMDGDCLVFVEVKTRRSSAYASPEIGVFADKRRRLRLLAESFISSWRPRFQNCRFDVVAVITEPIPRVIHIPDAF